MILTFLVFSVKPGSTEVIGFIQVRNLRQKLVTLLD